MAAGARYTVVVSSLYIYTNAADAKAYRSPKSTITNTSSSIDGAGEMYIDNFAGWESYAPAVPIWFIPSWGGAGWNIGWVNDNKNKVYTVTFKNWNGTTLKTQKVEINKNASPPSSPSRTGHFFTGWSGSYTNVISNRTITATFRINTYTVTFKNYNGTTLKTQTVGYGSNASPPTSPSLTGYTFTGWSGTYTTVTSNRTITAVFAIKSYTVIFKDWDNSTLKTQSVNYGSSASPPATPKRVGYNFIGWDRVYTNITSSRTITAIYEKAVPNFVMKVDGVNRNAAQMWVKVDGELRVAEQAKTLVNGQVKEI